MAAKMKILYLLLPLVTAAFKPFFDQPRDGTYQRLKTAASAVGSEHGTPTKVSEESHNATHLNMFTRRQCIQKADMKTGVMQYSLDYCDEYMPNLAQAAAHMQNGGWLNNPDKIPVYYTGWTSEQNPQIGKWIWAWMWKYTNQQGSPHPKAWYWFWDALENAWYATASVIAIMSISSTELAQVRDPAGTYRRKRGPNSEYSWVSTSFERFRRPRSS